MQYQEVAGGICAPKGFAAAGVHCGIRANHNEKYDLALIKADVRCAAAGVYTTNKVCGAPIKVDRAHLKDGYAQAILVNSGNANTCAANGVALAEECCELVGKELGIDPQDVLPASTGVIGQPMVIDPFARGIPAAAAKLAADEQGSTDAATAIMTTDTHKKEYAIQFELGGKTCTVGAIGKGSGMIAPNMATMLAFYTTDAAVSPALLEKALKTVVPGTYNQMSVDLDTSTNDTLIIMASGLAGNPEIWPLSGLIGTLFVPNQRRIFSMNQNSKFSVRDICYAGLFAAVIAVMAQISIPMPLGVPMTMQTFAITLAAVVLGSKLSAIATLVYLLLGAVGVPVLANFSGGIDKFVGPTGGFLISFPIMAYIIGLGVEHKDAFKGAFPVAVVVGTVVNYIVGVILFVIVAHSTVSVAVSACVLPFIPTAIIKAVLACVLGLNIRKRIPGVKKA